MELMQTTYKSTTINREQASIDLVYRKLLESANNLNQEELFDLFHEDAIVIGLDGVRIFGLTNIVNYLIESSDFKHAPEMQHIRSTRFLTPRLVVLHGVITSNSGKSDLVNVNIYHTLVLGADGDKFTIQALQSTALKDLDTDLFFN